MGGKFSFSLVLGTMRSLRTLRINPRFRSVMDVFFSLLVRLMGFVAGEPFAFGFWSVGLGDFVFMLPLNLILLPATGDLLIVLDFLGDGVRCRTGLFALSLRLGGEGLRLLGSSLTKNFFPRFRTCASSVLVSRLLRSGERLLLDSDSLLPLEFRSIILRILSRPRLAAPFTAVVEVGVATAA